MIQEFKKFIMRGNVLDLAIGVVIGASFSKIVDSMVNDVLMPPIGLIVGKVDFSNLFISLSGKHFHSLAEAKKAGAATLNYGLFINNIINFLIISFVIFLLIRQTNRFYKKDEPKEPVTKKCSECVSDIPIEARRCPHCTSYVNESENMLNSDLS
jgi:large conductance mechanosensitive channel